MPATVRASLGTANPSSPARRRVSCWRRVVATVLGAYLVSRLALVLTAAVVAGRHHVALVSVLTTWDSGYYVAIATGGYPSHVVAGPGVTGTPSALVAFFPLFPLLGKALAWVTGLSVVWSLVAVTWFAGAAGAVLASALVASRFGLRAALQAGVLLAVFPGSVVDGLVYADGVAVAFALGALLAAERRRVVLAGLLGAAATASLSLMLVPLLLALAATALAGRRWGGLLAPVLAACGAGAYFAYLWAHTGSPFSWSRVEHAGWMVHLSLPWSAGTAASSFAFSTPGVSLLTASSIVVALCGLVLLAALRAPLEWVLFSLVVLAAVSFDGGAWPAPRFVFDAFPLVLACGIALPRRALWPAAAVSVVLLALLLGAYSPPNRVFLNL
jgi:hypothetical protein